MSKAKEKLPPPRRDKLIIIDGNALIHRSFHALPPTMSTKAGEMVNAVYGFTTVLLKAIREFKPGYIALTLDRKGPTFRHQKYKEYKAKRKKAPDELYAQIPRVKEVATAFNIPIYEMTGFEADDIIGTVAAKVDNNIEKIIVTGDLDTLQLVNDHTKVFTLSRGLSDSITYDQKAVKARFSLTPGQMIDFKALRGDPSDNIPGVPGVGEKTAIELLKEFKTLDGIYENINSRKIKDRIRLLLQKHKKEAKMSKDLVTIRRNVKINFKLADVKFGDFNTDKVVKLFSELEFKSLLPRLQALIKGKAGQLDQGQETDMVDKFARNKKMFKYHLIDDDRKFKTFLAKIKIQSSFAFDTETSSLDPLTADLLGVSFSWKAGEAYYVEVRSKKLSPPRRDPARAGEVRSNLFNYKNKEKGKETKIHPWLRKLKSILENEKIRKYGHNIKFDLRVMQNQGINTAGISFDTMIASYLLNPGTRQHNLDALAFTELGYEKISKEDLLGSAFAKASADKKGKKKPDFTDVDLDKLYIYSCEDADFTFRLVKKLSSQLKKQELDILFKKIEMPLIEVLAKMEDEGVVIDKRFLAKMSQKMAKKIKQIEQKIYRQAGVRFNIKSTQQLREVLYEKLDIPTDNISKIKTGLSTAAEELAKLKNLHPIISLIQEYRELMKLTTTYIDALPALINKQTGRLHTSFNQTITATGRLSSTEPNLQNIPVRTELGREIRKAFVTEKGYKLVSLDYSQIELRLAAHMSGDRKMIKAFYEREDIHTATAAAIHRVNQETDNRAMRREAKAINFGILYGQGPHGLSQTADIPYGRAREFIEQYFIVYKDIKKFIDKTIKLARRRGYTETLFGRRRYLPEINSSVVQVRKAAERMAVNTPLQGTAADMIKVAMTEIANLSELRANDSESDVRMLLQVHDELLFEIKNSKIKEATKKIKRIMENVIKLKVPVIVDVSVGDNWGEMKELGIS
jgi:DNA polymerase-1